MSKGTGWPLYVMMCLMLLASVYIAWSMTGLRSSMDTQRDMVSELVAKEKRMTFFNEWTSVGQRYSVSTTCEENEGVPACLERHELAVTAYQKLHRPD